MRRWFETDYPLDELVLLGAYLGDPTEVHLIGGGSMAFRDFKAATNDIDLVVTKPETVAGIRSDLEEFAYREVQSPGQERVSLGAKAVLENEDDGRFDIFVKQFVDTLVLSKEIQPRSMESRQTGTLTVIATDGITFLLDAEPDERNRHDTVVT